MVCHEDRRVIAQQFITDVYVEIFLSTQSSPDIPVIDDVSGYSFPSGHALISVVFYGLFIHMIWHEVKTKWLRITIDDGPWDFDLVNSL